MAIDKTTYREDADADVEVVEVDNLNRDDKDVTNETAETASVVSNNWGTYVFMGLIALFAILSVIQLKVK